MDDMLANSNINISIKNKLNDSDNDICGSLLVLLSKT